MELNVPDWLDQTFLTNALKDDANKDENVEVVRFSVEPAMAPGNNYLSYMYRVRVEYKTSLLAENQTVTLMVKIPFAEGFMKEVSEKHDFFSKEPKIYNQLLPCLYKVAFCEFGPKTLNCPVKNVLVMKDLKEDGYILVDKIKQLDFFHSKVVIEKMAKFHAASVVCLRSNEDLIREVGVDVLFEESSIAKIAEQSLKNMVKIVTSDERYARLATFIADRYDQIWLSCTRLTKPTTDGGFNVLNHGDLWTNNMLFKYNSSGDVVDVKFIDFQLTRLSSPVNDLIYFIWTSTNEEVRGKRQHELNQVYLSTLNTTLAALGCDKRLSVQELRFDIARSVDFVIGVVSYFLPHMMASPEDVPDFANLTDEDYDSDKFHKIFKGNTFNKLLPKYLQQIADFFLDDKGMLAHVRMID